MASQDEVKEVFGYFEQKGDALCYRYQAERLFIEPWGENSLRVRSMKSAEMDKEDWALLPPAKACQPKIVVREDGGEITNGKIKAEINLIGKLSFYNQVRLRRRLTLLENSPFIIRRVSYCWRNTYGTAKICLAIRAVHWKWKRGSLNPLLAETTG